MIRSYHRACLSLALALLAISSPMEAREAPGGRVIQVRHDLGIRVPSGSPVRFVRVGKHDEAHFAGRFVIAGAYQYGCFVGCDSFPLKPDELVLKFFPEASLVAELPNWTGYDARAEEIFIKKPEPFVKALVGPKVLRELLAGKRPYVSGQASIVVDDFTMAIECDSPTYLARFVRIAPASEKPKPTPAREAGCG
jgi:hypothetical protein